MQTIKYDVIISLKTARVFIDVPPALLAIRGEVIEENRGMSAMPRKRRLAVKASPVAMGQIRTRPNRSSA